MSNLSGLEASAIPEPSLELIQALAQQIDLPLPPESAPAVLQNWLLLAAIARLLMHLELPQTLEPAPRFEP